MYAVGLACVRNLRPGEHLPELNFHYARHRTQRRCSSLRFLLLCWWVVQAAGVNVACIHEHVALSLKSLRYLVHDVLQCMFVALDAIACMSACWHPAARVFKIEKRKSV